MRLSAAVTLCIWLLASSVAAASLPELASSPPLPFRGQWDFIPLESPDRGVAKLIVMRQGVVWMATNGRVLYLLDQAVMRATELPADVDCPQHAGLQISRGVLGHDALRLDANRLLVSTIWNEIFVAEAGRLRQLTPPCNTSRAHYSFARLGAGKFFLGTSDTRINTVTETVFLAALAKEGFAKPTIVRGVDYLVANAGLVYGVSEAGAISSVDTATGKTAPLAIVPVQALHDVQIARNGHLLIAGAKGCFDLDPAAPASMTRFYGGVCFGLIEFGLHQTWASTDKGIFQFDGHQWHEAQKLDASGIGFAGKFAADQSGNLWVATNLGLWRHYNFIDEMSLEVDGVKNGARIMSLVSDRHGAVFASLEDSTVLQVGDAETKAILLPASSTTAYDRSRGPLLAVDPAGVVLALRRDGLYRDLRTTPVRIAPVPGDEQNVPSALAVCADGKVFAGQIWSSTIFLLKDDRWVADFTMAQYIGGNAIVALLCDDKSRVWAMGTERVAVRLRPGNWVQSEPIGIRNGGKIGFYGAFAPSAGENHMTAWGPWGAPVDIAVENNHLLVEAVIKVRATDPYLFYQAHSLADGRQIVLSDIGLLSVSKGNIARFKVLDEHLQLSARAFAVSAENTPVPVTMLAVDNLLLRVNIPREAPQIRMSSAFPQPLRTSSILLDFDTHVPVGPRTSSILRISVQPAIDGRTQFELSPPRPLTLTNLKNGTTYAISASLVDVAGNVSTPWFGTIHFVLPFFEDPAKTVWLAVISIMLLIVAISRRGPAEFLFRRMAGRRWRLVTSPPDRFLRITSAATGIAAELNKAGASVALVSHWRGDLAPRLDTLRAQVRRIGEQVLETTSRAGIEEFSSMLTRLRQAIDELTTENIGFSLRTQAGSELQLEIERSMSDLPWDLLSGPGAMPAGASFPIANVILGTKVPHALRIDGALRAFVYSASGTATPPGWEGERSRIVRTLKQSGVSDIAVGTSLMTKHQFMHHLVNCDLFHFVGHGELDGAGNALLRLNDQDHVSIVDIDAALTTAGKSPSIVFLNACGSLEERADNGGAAVTGLAAPFLARGAIVLGTKWPVQSDFATEFAVNFYSAALPPANSLLWKWVLRHPLAGQSVAKSAMSARAQLLAKTPSADPTWSAYVLFGNVTAWLMLE